MNKLYRMAVLAVTCFLVLKCSKSPTDYRSFLNNQEIVYPGVISGVKVFPGNQRLLLTWHPSPDPSVVKYIVFWNNGQDSLTVNTTTHNPSDTVKCYINDLSEYNYTFFIYAYDAKGNKSIPTEIDNVKVYGPIYAAGLFSRSYAEDLGTYNNSSFTAVTLHFTPPPDTVNVTTEIDYTDSTGASRKAWLSPDSATITLNSYKTGSNIFYRSAYIPVTGAIDTFYTASSDTFPTIYALCDKGLWKEALLPHDAVVNAYGTSLSWIWNGEPGAYPQIYHSDGAYMPLAFTIDLGKIYNNLIEFEEWGREDCSCHNPDDFEVWGISDTTGAEVDLPTTDPNWKAASIAKGWTLLTEVKRYDNGIAGVKVNLIANPPPVRFIRIRVLHTVDNSKASHMSEISFWYKP